MLITTSGGSGFSGRQISCEYELNCAECQMNQCEETNREPEGTTTTNTKVRILFRMDVSVTVDVADSKGVAGGADVKGSDLGATAELHVGFRRGRHAGAAWAAAGVGKDDDAVLLGDGKRAREHGVEPQRKRWRIHWHHRHNLVHPHIKYLYKWVSSVVEHTRCSERKTSILRGTV